ncbi:rna-directed dna polymerase from mobile element jockey-like protein, partial [Lasius niger]
METYIIKKTYNEGCVPVRESDKERGLLEDGRMSGSSMVGSVDNTDEYMDRNLLTAESLLDSKIDNMYKLIKEIKDEIIGKEVIRKVIYEELHKVRQEMQLWKTTELKLIISEVVKKEIQEARNIVPGSSTELGVVNTGTYSGAVKNEQVGITKMKRVTRGAVVVACENKTQADKLKEEVEKDLGGKYVIQSPMKKRLKLRIVDVDKEDYENEQDFWRKIKDQNGLKNDISGKIIHKLTKERSRGVVIIAERLVRMYILNDNVIVLGDFNVDMKVKNHIQKKLIKAMNTVGLRQLVTEATRVAISSETIIDLVFSNLEVDIEVCHEPKITDHSTVVLYWNRNEIEKKSKLIVRRDYKCMDVEEFKRMISAQLNVMDGDSIELVANSAINVIVNSLDKVAPRKAIVLKEKWKGKQWFSGNVYCLAKQRDTAYRVARISKNVNDWELFRQLRNKVVDECRKAKREYLEEKLDKNRKDPKQMWRSLKEIMKGSSYNNEYKEIRYGDDIISNVEEMANKFNCYFVNSVKQLRIDSSEDGPKNNIIRHENNTFEVFKEIGIQWLYRVVSRLANKAGTEEGITVEIMKLVVEAAGEKVCHILNRSLEEGRFPNEWKEATVVPVPKVQGTINIEKFRPINKLPVYEKILEIMVHSQLVEYLESNDILKECQSGFRTKHSCETVLQWVISSWKKIIGEGKMIGVIFLDLKRAFELVDREILINKLQWYGIKGTVLNWFASYLDNRTQKVKFNGILSEAIKLDLGVPQG